MEALLSLKALPPIKFSFSFFSSTEKGDPKMIWLKEFHEMASESFCRTSRRRLLSESVAMATTMYINPALCLPTQEAKDSEIVRYQKMNSGVKIEEIIEGQGPEAHEGDLVKINYVCRRSNGYFVHSTVNQFSGETSPVILALGGSEIIQGLKDVLVGMKVGGKRRALIPPNVGYVNENLKPIPDEFGPRRSLLSHANEPLIFEVQLLKVL
ncbi:peptidyl-prolyl cis-trans isomerase FKBP16-1, chloroplastic isoform X1 [Iris pallida]|uniref:peptidylprolyl isomerase n=1 Tax=Iris pallida TaxID=29817 RepID=A0AAX6GXD2_IRIPA|nr:peptidyl-prolyl cis-trans isomerase FKBP16-1, chloroplastic isoform X1 [Iris pallida]KAJ6832977.1 peptidyl-prolyl cis-trans isomerase FKBP16-1, chloroplastic isoform X1 [Iris pallida]